ncbi:MAG: glycosyltransferase [Chloroflexia bacterium]|nr:glycosyltransferase [Chloroflexia bacterium]
MRISVVGPTFPYRGGIAHYTTLLVQYLRQRQHEAYLHSYRRQYPKLFFPGNTDPDPSEQALCVDCEYILDPILPWTWWRTFRRIRQLDPALLLLQWWTPFWTPVLFALTAWIHHWTHIPILFLCHHIIPPDGGPLDWSLARFVFQRANGFIVLSEEDFALLRRALPQAYIRGTTLPALPRFGQPLPQAEARSRLGLPSDEPVLLFFGFVRRYKGLRYLLQALPQVRQRLPLRLLVVGEFWEDERPYQELLDELDLQDSVQLINRYVPNEEMGLYFSAADVVTLPYLEASQSGVVQMAFAFKRPVITTRVGGLADTVEDEKSGLIVPPGDSAALAQAILRYFEDDLGPRFQAYIEQSEESFAWDRLIDLVELMHTEILRRGS